MIQSQKPQDSFVRQISAGGRGAIGILELSGPGSSELLAAHMTKTPKNWRAQTSAYSMLIDANGSELDDALVLKLDQDCYWICLHGNPVILRKVQESFQSRGSRIDSRAEGKVSQGPGYWKQEQRKAVQYAASEKALYYLLRPQQKQFENLANVLQNKKPEEQIRYLQALLDNSKWASSLYNAKRIVLAGAPNAGKSTLFNHWLGEERVIASPEAGTTRDLIESQIRMGDCPVLLQDGAGLRASAKSIEAQGIERMQKAIESADLILWLVGPQSFTISEEHLKLLSSFGNKVLVIFSQADRLSNNFAELQNSMIQQLSSLGIVCHSASFSVESKQGMPELEEAVNSQLIGEHPASLEDYPIVWTSRQVALVEASLNELKKAKDPIPWLREL